MGLILKLLSNGSQALLDYLSAHVLTCLVPAFFIAGTIRVFISQTSVLKYFGPRANKWVSYSLASVSGMILAACSCTVIPMFAGMVMGSAGRTGIESAQYAGDSQHYGNKKDADVCNYCSDYGNDQWSGFWRDCLI